MFGRILIFVGALLLAAAPAGPAAAAIYEPSAQSPPPPAREFRGAWIATVGNLTWPSQPGLTTAAQKAELVALLDRAAALKLNAVIFQVRTSCDALYASRLEPWSEYLTGTMGQAPEPFYDPLEFAITEAHRRGLELHAWFNPYRARYLKAISPVSSRHVSRAQPQLVHPYGNQLWLDPGDPAVQDYSLSVVLDVARRYDVDGVHFDDYFYPYPEKDASGAELNFPDSVSWHKYGDATGLKRPDWRRANVNRFIQRVNQGVHALKPWVKFGLSPFGIWRPGNPPPIRGLDAYDKLGADARQWLAAGWCDYFSPQLYWPIAEKEHSFTTLLDWWLEQDAKGRHVWPGLNSLKVGNSGWAPSEITRQVQIIRSRTRSPGHVHWSLGALTTGHAGLGAALAGECYAQPALVPACPWLGNERLREAAVSVGSAESGGPVLRFRAAAGQTAARWVLQVKNGGRWTTRLAPGSASTARLDDPPPEVVAVTPVDRFGNTGPAVVLERRGN